MDEGRRLPPSMGGQRPSTQNSNPYPELFIPPKGMRGSTGQCDIFETAVIHHQCAREHLSTGVPLDLGSSASMPGSAPTIELRLAARRAGAGSGRTAI